MFLDSDYALESSYGHKKKENGEQEVLLSKLSKVSLDKQSSAGKQALNGMTKKAVSNYPIKKEKIR